MILKYTHTHTHTHTYIYIIKLMVHENLYRQRNRGIICIRETNYLKKKMKESEGPFVRLYSCNTIGEND